MPSCPPFPRVGLAPPGNPRPQWDTGADLPPVASGLTADGYLHGEEIPGLQYHLTTFTTGF
jgi:hypothetical protein